MKIETVHWKEQFAEKVERKHGVTTQEVEDVLRGNPHMRRAEKGRVKGEDVYVAFGQTQSGRYLFVAFVYKGQNSALPISARDMTAAERSYYREQTQAN